MSTTRQDFASLTREQGESHLSRIPSRPRLQPLVPEPASPRGPPQPWYLLLSRCLHLSLLLLLLPQTW